jgi:pilus assembly protein Flp/PilA
MGGIINKLWERVVNSVADSRLVKSQWGASAVEYALLVSLIAVAIIASVTLLGDKIKAVFTAIAGKF